jgi:HAD superfamily hydrolase (TIGR01549 family)
MGKFKLIIFDLDGTLTDAYPAITRSFNFAMRSFGYPGQSKLVIRRAVGWGDTHLVKSFVKDKDVSRVLRAYRRDHKTSLARYSRVFPGTMRLLDSLKAAGYKLAVATNRPTRFSRILIRCLGLKPYFDYVLCADKLKAGKPNPEILRRIMGRLSAKASETLYVGDMVIDAQAGRRARVKTVIVTTGSSSRKEIKAEKPWKLVKSLKTLSKLL